MCLNTSQSLINYVVSFVPLRYSTLSPPIFEKFSTSNTLHYDLGSQKLASVIVC